MTPLSLPSPLAAVVVLDMSPRLLNGPQFASASLPPPRCGCDFHSALIFRNEEKLRSSSALKPRLSRRHR